MKRLVVVFLSLGVFVATVPRADEGHIPIFRPTTITQPGHYVLTRDISVTSGDVIVVGATDVTLDLNGHLISSSDPGSTLIRIGDVQDAVATIRNGRLSGGHESILSVTKPGLRLRVEHVEMDGSAHGILVDLAQSVQIIGCRISGATSDPAVQISGSPVTGEIADNLITDARGGGLTLFNFRGGSVHGNSVTNFGTGASFTAGILIDSSGPPSTDLGGTVIDGNVIRKSDDDLGIVVSAGSNNLLTHNVVSGLGSSGIIVRTSGNRLADNVSSSNAGDGIDIGCATCAAADHNILERNTVRGNLFFIGVQVQGGSNLIDDNLIEGNGKGISFVTGTNNAYRGNMLRDNGLAVAGAATDAGGNIL